MEFIRKESVRMVAVVVADNITTLFILTIDHL